MFESFFRRFRGGDSTPSAATSPTGLPSNSERLSASLRPFQQTREDAVREWTGDRESTSVPSQEAVSAALSPEQPAAPIPAENSEPLPADPWTADEAPTLGAWSKTKSPEKSDPDSLAA